MSLTGQQINWLLGIVYRCYLSRQLNPVSEIMGEDQGLYGKDVLAEDIRFVEW
jgi:hypothetical protein